MRILFFFIDGVGLGSQSPEINPFARVSMPFLEDLLNGHRLLNSIAFPLITHQATLLALDASLGVAGIPQSATGQATLLTGINISERLGYHYGPKPNRDVADLLNNGNLFNRLKTAGYQSALLNAYPPRYFDGIERGHRLPGAIAMAAYQAGLQLMTIEDLYRGNAISADLTGQGWQSHLGYADAPILTPRQAGERLANLSNNYDFSLFEYWLSDVIGHHQDMDQACELLRTLDQTLEGLVDAWDKDAGLILLVSDHGNLEDLSTRRHTLNCVPLLVIGASRLREQFINKLNQGKSSSLDITHLAPVIFTTIAEGNL
jgi:hypothetical protein